MSRHWVNLKSDVIPAVAGAESRDPVSLNEMGSRIRAEALSGMTWEGKLTHDLKMHAVYFSGGFWACPCFRKGHAPLFSITAIQMKSAFS
jgi:hypothetical protein